MELDAGAGAWCWCKYSAMSWHARLECSANANLAVLVQMAEEEHLIGSQEAPIGSSQIDFRDCASPRAGTYTQVVSSAAEDYSEVPNRCSGVLEAPVDLQTSCSTK